MCIIQLLPSSYTARIEICWPNNDVIIQKSLRKLKCFDHSTATIFSEKCNAVHVYIAGQGDIRM